MPPMQETPFSRRYIYCICMCVCARSHGGFPTDAMCDVRCCVRLGNFLSGAGLKRGRGRGFNCTAALLFIYLLLLFLLPIFCCRSCF